MIFPICFYLKWNINSKHLIEKPKQTIAIVLEK